MGEENPTEIVDNYLLQCLKLNSTIHCSFKSFGGFSSYENMVEVLQD
jgi:hypothetical protein